MSKLEEFERLRWSDDERKQIIEKAKEVLSDYIVLDRRAKSMLAIKPPGVKSPTMSSEPKSQKLGNASEDRVIHYLTAKEQAEQYREQVDEIYNSVRKCSIVSAVILTMRYLEQHSDEEIWTAVHYEKAWYYETGLPNAVSEFAEIWHNGEIPRAVQNGLLAD
ncbi:ArpU family phage packaging/lysis transcriptional regulator [Pseudolactococcus reticulitermitis]|uniref:Phage protein n=1 Tax=Pseudolactococcus reticulitermitis TaxID=2025039 RepID=A0A224XAU6_9LACT|nr:ArpU family phage packaging/lysis transcriptional regulator [Lactococcus reticulitermitis]GAX46781.1 hypothetical protein RsY01_361 [Lactococcus reticulitermitis]